MKGIRGTLALLLSLKKEGVNTLFGYPGGAIMPFYDELYDHLDEFKHILVRHEQGAVHAAQGYARTTGKTGVCVATAGPGATNFVTGIADAMLDSTPIVCITAQVNKDNLGTCFFQEADMINITLPITKWSHQITSADEIPSVVARAFYVASHGRPGPVVISITRNAQVELTDFEYDRERFLEDLMCPAIQLPPAPVPADIDKAVAMIHQAKRPLVIAGHGVAIAHAQEKLLELCERTGIPVASTLLGLATVPSEHPQYVGCAGMHGSLAPNRMTQEADLVFAIGMRFSDRVTGSLTHYAPKAKIIHVDIDPAEIDKNVKTDLSIVADAKVVLDEMCKRDLQHKDYTEWKEYAKESRSLEVEIVDKTDLADAGPIKMGQAVAAVSKYCDKDAIIVSDVGQNQMFAARYSNFGKKGKWVTSGGLGTMGFGLPAAIGAKVANPGSQVIVYLGDGGFQMNLQELGTIMQNKVDVKMVLLNNTYLGMVRQWQELFFDKRYACTHLQNPDFMKLLSAYDIHAERVIEASQLDGAVQRLLSCKGPSFLEVATDPEENVFPMVPAGYPLDRIALRKEDL